jgi:hypothetical protein
MLVIKDFSNESKKFFNQITFGGIMSNITRRSFLKASTGAVCASALGGPMITKPSENLQNNKNAKVYTVFVTSGPSHNDSSIVPTPSEEVLRRLKKKCVEVDFITRDLEKSVTFEEVINEMKDLKKLKFDGVLIIGQSRNYALTETAGLPTIVVHNLHEFMGNPYALYINQGKILFSELDRLDISSDPAILPAMYKDLADKINLFSVLKKMKESRILAITRSGSKYVNDYRGDTRKTYLPGYNEIILDALDQALGANVTKIGLNEVSADEEIKNIWYNDNKEAEEIAKMWIGEAKEMRNTLESEVVKSAKMYLAEKILMKKYNATAIACHIRSLVKNPKPEDMVWPSLGNSELQKQGIVACCQLHLNVVLTHMLAQYAFGKSSMMGDFTIDPYNNVTIVMHCGGPHNPHGGNTRVPYNIRDHAERPVKGHSKPGCGACSEVLYPPGEPVTIWRIDLLTKNILVHTGTTANHNIYKDFYKEIMCRTRLVTKVNDAEKIQKFIYPDKYGVHRSGVLGDYREEIKDLATLIGYNVIEEDV